MLHTMRAFSISIHGEINVYYYYYYFYFSLSLSYCLTMKVIKAGDVTTLVKDMQISTIPSKKRQINNGPPKDSILKLLDQDGAQLLIRSQPFFCTFGQFTKTNGVFPVNMEKDKKLFEAISHIEQKAEMALSKKEDRQIKVRPVYTNNVAWLKSAQDLTIYDWDGKNKLSSDDISSGHYQMVIRAYNIFNGQHGDTDYKYSVLFRVAQLRFSPVPKFTGKQQTYFMFDASEPFEEEPPTTSTDCDLAIVSVSGGGEVRVWPIVEEDQQTVIIDEEMSTAPQDDQQTPMREETSTAQDEDDDEIATKKPRKQKSKKKKLVNPPTEG